MINGRALHFVFKVSDRSLTAKFYRDILGMKVKGYFPFKFYLNYIIVILITTISNICIKTPLSVLYETDRSGEPQGHLYRQPVNLKLELITWHIYIKVYDIAVYKQYIYFVVFLVFMLNMHLTGSLLHLYLIY